MSCKYPHTCQMTIGPLPDGTIPMPPETDRTVAFLFSFFGNNQWPSKAKQRMLMGVMVIYNLPLSLLRSDPLCPSLMSEGEKRKLHADDVQDVVPGTTQKKKARDGLVTDDEVEEFCTILRRLNAAAQYFKSSGDRKDGTAASHRGWRASLEEEIARQVDSVKEKEAIAIDLNLSPGQE
ncbi:uncharacterized protein LOC114726199 [Neltuma alba]|uniref:uncharacterized protein LOC114726199 n=1 Tax=Neltuma alba TaxID=207710 RepID=UPI0010A36908|nr:uncharacterized protein LOC114726199 [Prosopis alba]